MNAEISISIIIPIYNSEKYIGHCIESLFCQDMDGLEYIFIDDCSSDKSLAIVERLIESKYISFKKYIRIIKLKENEGVANARNIGIKKANGEYIGFVDSDDWIELNMFSLLLKKAKEMDADIVGCNFINEYSDVSYEFCQSYSRNKNLNISRLLTGKIFPSLCTEIVKKKLYIDNNIRFEMGVNMGEDLLANVKLYSLANKISYIDDAMYHYWHNENSSCVIRSLNSIMSDIKVASLIEQYLLSNHKYKEYEKEILYRKFLSKLPLWTIREFRNVELWRNIYKDSNKYIFSYSQFDWKMKLEYWLANKGLYKVADIFVYMLRVQRRIRSKYK